MSEVNGISAIIITIGRKLTVLRLLKCLSNQILLPREVIIVEGGDESWTVDDFPHQLKNIYRIVYVTRGAATDSREKGRKIAKGSILAFFDDDIIIPNDYLKNAYEYLSHNREIMAVGGIYEDQNTISRTEASIRIGKLLGIYGNGEGNRILKSGWGDYVRGIHALNITDAEWLFGCNAVLRRDVFKKKKSIFELGMEKWCFLDDLTMGARLTRAFGRCMKVLPELKVIHDPPSSSGEISPETIRMRVLYRYIFWRDECKNQSLSSKLHYFSGVIANIILLIKQKPYFWVLLECLSANLYCLKFPKMRWDEANEFVFSKN